MIISYAQSLKTSDQIIKPSNYIIFIIVWYCGVATCVLAQDEAPVGDSLYLATCAQAVQALNPIFQGEVPVEEHLEDDSDSTITQNYPYTVYAIQHHNNWILLVVDLSGFYSYTKWSDVNALFENTPYVDYTLCEIITGNHYEKAENKKKEQFIIGDYVFTDYYILKKEGKKLWEQVILMEYDRKSKRGLLEKIFNLGKVKDMKKTAMDQQKALEQKSQEMQDMEKQLKYLKEELKNLQERLEDCENPEPKNDQDTLLIVQKKDTITPHQDETDIDKALQTDHKDTIKIKKELTTPPIDQTDTNATEVSNDTLNLEPKSNPALTHQSQPLDSVAVEQAYVHHANLKMIKQQKDSLETLLRETIDLSIRNKLHKAKDSLDKAYEMELYLQMSTLEKNIPDNQKDSLNTGIELSQLSEELKALKEQHDHIELQIEELSMLLEQTTELEKQREVMQKINKLKEDREVIVRKMLKQTTSNNN